jgi:hypothetical protein
MSQNLFKVLVIRFDYKDKKSVVHEDEDLQKLLCLSKTGSIKINYKNKPAYLKADCVDNYSVQALRNEAVMVFSNDYNIQKAFAIFSKYFFDVSTRRLQEVKDTVSYWQEQLDSCKVFV